MISNSHRARLGYYLAVFFFSLYVVNVFQRNPHVFLGNSLSSSRPLYDYQGLTPQHLATPADLSREFPKKLWQTWRVSVSGMTDEERRVVGSWQKLNAKYRYELLTDAGALEYVHDRFGGTEVDEAFRSLRDPILRADLIRYLVLLGDGGVYADMDCRALKPITDWIPLQYAGRANLVVGVEYDKQDGNRWPDWPRDLQFTNWAIMAKPGHAVLELTVQMALLHLRGLALQEGKELGDVDSTYNQVLESTGPAIFTDAVFGYLTDATGETYNWLNVTKLQHPRLVHDVLILPINAFGSGQAHSQSGETIAEDAFVHHLFKGSWKDDSRPVGS